MPYIQVSSPQSKTGLPGIRDVYHSPNVYANNVPVALWLEAQDTAAFTSGLSAPDVSYVLEQADADGVSDGAKAQADIQATIDVGTSTGIISTTSSVLLPSTQGTVDPSTGAVITGTVYTANWDQFNENNIPYDTLMLTPRTSLATFTTKSALWNNQPTPLGPRTPYGPGSKGDNKHIIPQYGLTVPQILHNLSNLAANVYEPIKDRYPNVVITNTFRQGPPGGKSQQAQHGLGMAMDLVFPGATPQQYYDIAVWIRDNVPYDQLLQEKAGNTIWIHISHYSGYGTQVKPVNRVANMIVSPVASFTPGLAPFA